MRKILLTMLGVAIYITPANAQTRLTADFQIGTESGLGYHLPYYAFGASIEQPIHRFEYQCGGDYSPTHKLVTNDGHQFHADGAMIAWATSHVGLLGGDGEAWLATSQFSKHANVPAAGVVFRMMMLGTPSRIYLKYLVPTGARPTDGSLQSNRTQGVSFVLENLLWSRVRMDTTFDMLTFLSQSGAAPSPRSWEGTVVITLRVGTKQDVNAIY